MRRLLLVLGILCALANSARAQTPEVKFIAATVVVQAEGSYEADGDLVTLTFENFNVGQRHQKGLRHGDAIHAKDYRAGREERAQEISTITTNLIFSLPGAAKSSSPAAPTPAYPSIDP